MSFRDRVDPEQLLQALGIAFKRKGDTLRALCPNPDHDDHEPSWTIVDAPTTRKHCGHRCFSCGFSGGPWELVMAVRGVDEKGAAEFVGSLVTGKPREFPGLPKVVVVGDGRTREPFRLPWGVRIPSLEGTVMPDVFADYLTGRGVTSEQVERWQIGYATRGRLAWRVVLPVHTRGRLVAYVGRAVFGDRARYDMPYAGGGAEPSVALLGEPFLTENSDVLTIAEGSFSLLALERACAPNPVALLGSDWSPEKAAVLTARRWERVIVATDPDAAGDKVAAAIEVSFRRTKIVRLRMSRSPDDSLPTEVEAAVRDAIA